MEAIATVCERSFKNKFCCLNMCSFGPRDLMTHPRRGATDKIFFFYLVSLKHRIIYSPSQRSADDFSISMFLLGFLKHTETSTLSNGFFLTVEGAHGYNLQPPLSPERTVEYTSVNSCIKMATGTAITQMEATRVKQQRSVICFCFFCFFIKSREIQLQKKCFQRKYVFLDAVKPALCSCSFEDFTLSQNLARYRDQNVAPVFQTDPSSHHLAL